MEVGQPHLNNDDGVCTEERLCNQPLLSRQFPPIVLPPVPGGGTLPPGLQIPCICCQDCQDTQCSALPGHVCVREEIAREDRLVVLDSCQEDRCSPLPGQGTCLCCAVRNITTTTTMQTFTSGSTTISSTTDQTPVVISSTTRTTTWIPTTAPAFSTTNPVPTTTKSNPDPNSFWPI